MGPHLLPDGGRTQFSILFYAILLFALTALGAQISRFDNVRQYMNVLGLFTLIACLSTPRA